MQIARKILEVSGISALGSRSGLKGSPKMVAAAENLISDHQDAKTWDPILLQPPGSVCGALPESVHTS